MSLPTKVFCNMSKCSVKGPAPCLCLAIAIVIFSLTSIHLRGIIVLTMTNLDYELNLTRNDLLSALGFICIVHGLPPLRELWNKTFPNEFMDADQEAQILFGSVFQVEQFEIHSEDDVTLILSFLEDDGLAGLAHLARSELLLSRQ